MADGREHAVEWLRLVSGHVRPVEADFILDGIDDGRAGGRAQSAGMGITTLPDDQWLLRTHAARPADVPVAASTCPGATVSAA